MKIENLEAVNNVFKRLNNLRRWTNFITEGKYDEISKQALNCAVCFMLAVEAEKEGCLINWERFPKIAIYRAFQKAYVNYDTPEHILKEICELGGIQFDKAFGEATEKTIDGKTVIEDGYFLLKGNNLTSTVESSLKVKVTDIWKRSVTSTVPVKITVE